MISSKRIAKVERLFYILMYLGNHDYVTANTLANHCGTSTRSIYRDMKTLEELGVQYISEGKLGYRLIYKPYRSNSMLNSNEWLALTLFPILSDGITSKEYPFHHNYKSAIEKIRSYVNTDNDISTIGAELGERIRLHTQPKDPNQYVVMPSVIEAILLNKSVEASYHSMHRNTNTIRTLDPYFLVPRQGHLYLIAYCHLREDIRIFRLNRFHHFKLTNSSFTFPKSFNIDDFLHNRWSIMDEGKDSTFVVKFAKEVARYVEEQDFQVKTDLEVKDDGSLLLRTTVKSQEEFLRWVRSFGIHAEVLEPTEVWERLREEYREMAGRYGENCNI